MSEKKCSKCGRNIRQSAKFCPHCGSDQIKSILSFNDFFDDEEKTKEEVAHSSQVSEEKKEAIGNKEKIKGIQSLDDTLELSIKEIEAEIERKKSDRKDRIKTEEELKKDKKEIRGLFNILKEEQGKDILISEDEILRDEDIPKNHSLFNRIKSFLIGKDLKDIEGRDILAEEKIEEEKVRAALEEEKVKKESFLNKIFLVKGKEEKIEEKEKEKEKEKKKAFSLFKNIKTLAAVLGVVVLLLVFSLVLTGENIANPKEISASFKEAIEEGEVNQLAKLINVEGENISVNETNLAPFFELMKDQEYKEKIYGALDSYDEEKGRTPDEDVWIEKTEKSLFFFNQYELKIKAFDVQAIVSYDDTLVWLDDNKKENVNQKNSNILGPYIAGKYEINSLYEGGLSSLSNERKLILTGANAEDDLITVDLQLLGKYAFVENKIEEAILIVNGEEKSKLKNLDEDFKIGPFDSPVDIQLALETPFGKALSDTIQAVEDEQELIFEFKNMPLIVGDVDEAEIILNGEKKEVKISDFISYEGRLGPIEAEDSIQLVMEIDGRQTLSNIIVYDEQEEIQFRFFKELAFEWRHSDATVLLDGEDTGMTVYDMAGSDMKAEVLNSYETIQLTKTYPWGDFKSGTIDLTNIGNGEELSFEFNPVSETLYRQLQDAVVTFLEEDAFAISNLKPNNYSNTEGSLAEERSSYIQDLIDKKTRIVRVSDKAEFDMDSIQFDDEDTYYARITETYSYHYQEYEAGIFRPVRLEMQEKSEIYQHALRYDKDSSIWVIYENRPLESMNTENTQSIDLAY